MGVAIIPSVETGMTSSRIRDLSNEPQVVRASLVNLYSVQVANTQQFDAWVLLFNKLNPQLGIDFPLKAFKIPGNDFKTFSFQPQGVKFDTALVVVSMTALLGGTGSAKGVHFFVDYVYP